MASEPAPDPTPDNAAPDEDPALDARRLLRAARGGTLATSAAGQPFASLVTPATAPDGSALLLLSDLSEHTRHLRAEPRCALLVAGAAEGPNPQTAPRLTLTGLAELEPDPALHARWVAAHPYAAFYAGFGDFHLWRLRPRGGLFVAGFAQAHRLREAQLTPDPDAVASVAAAEAGIITHCNGDHADALALIAEAHGAPPGEWRMAAVDVDGCDLTDGEGALRVPWSAPVAGPGEVRAELMRLVGAARHRA
jgi:putative heme iron utilization protein